MSTEASNKILDDSNKYTISTGEYVSNLAQVRSTFSIVNPTVTDTGYFTCKWILPGGSIVNPQATVTVVVRCKFDL